MKKVKDEAAAAEGEKKKQASSGSASKGRSKKQQRATYKQSLSNGVHLRNKLRRIRRHILRMGKVTQPGQLDFGAWCAADALVRFTELGGKAEQLRVKHA